MRPRSLRSRLVLAAVGSILLALVAFGVAAEIVTRHELRATLDRALRQRAGDVERLAVSAPAVLSSPGALEAPVGGQEVAVEVLDSRGRIIARSVALGARLLPDDAVVRRARRGRPGIETVSLGTRRLRLYAAPIAAAGGPASSGAVIVASDIADTETTTHRLAILLALSGALTAGLAILVALVLTRRGLRPLSRLAGAAGEIERTADASRRLPAQAANDEIAGLTAVLNRMLASLEHARETERRLLADASHELRTPVAALLGNVEFAAKHGAGPEVMADLRHDAARLARLVDDLLTLERARVDDRPFTRVRLDEVVRRFEDARVEVAAPAAVVVDGDEEALIRVVRNLVENARIHGPADGTVTVEVEQRGSTGVLRVRDQGAGPPTASYGHLFDRFWRGPGTTQRPGSGLGLAIVATVISRHSGTVEVEGSTFTVVVPSRTPSRTGIDG